MLYIDFKSQVICNKEVTDTFNVSTEVKEGCILSLFLFILAMDWIMKNSTDRKVRSQMDHDNDNNNTGRSGLCR
jgi:hypothetical protein